MLVALHVRCGERDESPRWRTGVMQQAAAGLCRGREFGAAGRNVGCNRTRHGASCMTVLKLRQFPNFGATPAGTEGTAWGCRSSIWGLLGRLKPPRLGDGNTHRAACHRANPCPREVALFQITESPKSLAFVKVLHSDCIHSAAPIIALPDISPHLSDCVGHFAARECLEAVYPTRRFGLSGDQFREPSRQR